MSKRAVLYARVSGDDRRKEGRNLDGQLEMGREHCAEKGYRIIAELAEDERGASGADFDLPQLNKALEMARAGEFDVLVVRELDRFARGLAKQLIVEGEFKRAGVQIEYVLGEYPDTPEGNLNKNVKAVIAEYERLKIRERMERGRRLKVKAGSVMVQGRPPYGYRVEERDGKWVLEINEQEARIVRMIFSWYAEGASLSDIARKLSEMRIPTFGDTGTRNYTKPKKKQFGEWTKSSVASILRNETYIGIWRYGKRAKRNGRWAQNPDSHLLSVSVPAIVTRNAWEAVQKQRIQKRKGTRRKPRGQFLLAGRVTCGACGAKMRCTSTRTGTRLYRYYRCGAFRNLDYVHPCNARGFRAGPVDSVVWEWVRSYLIDPVKLAEGLQEYKTEHEKENEPLRERLQMIDELLSSNKAQLEKLLDLYLSEDFSRDILIERKNRLGTTVKALESQRADLVAHLEAQTLTNEQIQSLQDFAKLVAEGLEAADISFEARRGIIENLDVHATLVVESDERVAYVRCILGERILPVVQDPRGFCITMTHYE